MRRAALALLLLLAAPAEGAIIYMAPTALGSGDGSSAANAKNWFLNVNTWSAGDVIRLVDGTYTSVMSLSVSGSAGNRVTIEGNIANPAAVRFTGALTLAANYVTVKGIGFDTGGLTVPTNQSNDSIAYCRTLAGGVTCMYGSNNVIYRCTATSTGEVFLFDCQIPALPGSGAKSTLNTVRGCTITAPYTALRGSNNCTADSNTFNLTIGSGFADDVHFMTLYVCRTLTFTNNQMFALNNTIQERRMFVYRDSTMMCTVSRNNFFANSASVGTVPGIMSTGGAYNYTYAMTFSNNFVKAWRANAVTYSVRCARSTFHNNVFLSSDARAVSLVLNTPSETDSLTFTHNTLVSLGQCDRGVFTQDDTQETNRIVRHNIFYTVGNNSAGSGTGLGYFHGPSMTTGNVHNWNLFFSRGGSSSNAVKHQFTYSPVGLGTTWNTQSSRPDSASVWGSPRFTDSTYAAFDPTFGANSFAVSASWPDGYVGAQFSTSNPPLGDTEPPGAVNDLSGAPLSPTRIAISWTAPGDDGFVGVPASVTLKRHSSQINSEAAWSAATTVATLTGGSLSSGGEQQTYDVNTGLSASTTYWFAVRGTDEVPNTGSISNSISVTTPASPDVTAPDPVASLSAQALTPTSIRVTWTATGDNGATGQAANYRLKRRAGTTFVLGDSAAATAVTGLTSPKSAGQSESFIVGGLSANTSYAFALWVADVAGNTSTISNAATATTFANPSIAVNTGNRRRRR